ncbi:MAG: hypothetical protein HQK60_10735 [Deltaproteobacteria bacterium]|nr:hypothetical protein [Deltaproteobacteria bacterium]
MSGHRLIIFALTMIVVVTVLTPIDNPVQSAAAQAVYYEPTIEPIVAADCGRCHFGSIRYLGDYNDLKMYADSGLLATMVQGPMRRFAGSDADTLLTWIDQGAPEKANGTLAQFRAGPQGSPGPGHPPGGRGNGPLVQLTYRDPIKDILAQDCLRCHSGPFRNMTTYKHVKTYADNGLLKLLVKAGGPMHRFAGPDAGIIIDWINAGAPE